MIKTIEEAIEILKKEIKELKDVEFNPTIDYAFVEVRKSRIEGMKRVLNLSYEEFVKIRNEALRNS